MFAVSFINAWALGVGGAAVALPIAVHLLSRPKPRRMSLPTIRFLQQVMHQRRTRSRIRDWLVLALRTLAVCLLAVAFARPLMGERPIVSNDEAGDAMRIVLLDVSQSMSAATPGDASPLERGRRAASDALVYRPGLRANLILAGATPRLALPGPTTNLAALRDALASATSQTEGLNVPAAVDVAARMLGSTPPGHRRELVVVSDFQRTNWTAANFAALPADTRIQLRSVAPPSQPANFAITRIAARGRVEANRPVQFDVELFNDSVTADHATIELRLGDRVVRSESDVTPRSRTTVAMSLVPPTAGWSTGSARLVEHLDALPADDERPIALAVAPPPTFALVTREPAQPAPRSSHFVQRALLPRDSDGSRITRLDPAKLDVDALTRASLVLLDHPGKLTDAQATQLAELIRHGQRVLYIAAEPVDAANLDAIARAAGDDWALPVSFVAPPDGTDRTGRFFATWRRDAPGIALLGESAGAAVGPLRFAGGLDTPQRDGHGLADDLLVTYGDRSAALVVADCGSGRVGVLNADLSRSNIVASPLFVPLIDQLADRLLARSGEDGDARPSGMPLLATLPPNAHSDSVKLVGPSGSNGDLGELLDEAGQTIWRWPRAGRAGVYRAVEGDRTLFAVATAAPADEAELTPLDGALLTTRLNGGRQTQFQSHIAGDLTRRDTFWATAILAVAACMFFELALTGRSRI